MSLSQQLSDIGYRFRRALRDPVLLERYGLAPFQARALVFVARFPGSRQQRFVEGTGRDKGQVARLFRELEQRGLVTRRPDPTDGRASLYFLTEDGKRTAEALLAHREAVSAAMVTALSPEERENLASLLDRVRLGLDGLISDDGSGRRP